MTNALKARDIALMIDHSLLQPQLTHQNIVDGCVIAREYGTASVCVRPCDVVLAGELLQDSGVKISTVIGFPHGSNITQIKVAEAELALSQGAVELDMVQNIGAFLSGNHKLVEMDIAAVCGLAHAQNAIVKVILENCYLTPEQIAEACKIAEQAGADFVKTSTGYGSSGATLDDLKIMRMSVSPTVRVKAAGGVRTLDAVLAVRAVGATRVGATATVAIMEDAMVREQAGTLVEAETGELGQGY